MILKAILNEIDSSVSALTLGTNLFGVQGRLDKCVVVNMTYNSGEPTIPELHYASVQALVKGYGVEDGYNMAISVANAILSTEASEIADGTNKYQVMSTTIKNWPLSYTTDKGVVYTTNIAITYKT